MIKGRHLSEKVIKYILSRSNEELGELTVKRIAYILKISQSHLYDTFKTEKKITPGRFLIMIKMYRSALMLEEEQKLPIKKISKKMGFSSSDYFNKVFREYFGTTPGKYRGYVNRKY
ncbi:MAG: helix-turn-helix transcriptional regulator [Candidatus Aminicenantes bacterium]|nr:MAG: helix-turn-helix transcriptional regulator [Candidatus Aminicenantes bacterium]